MFSHAITRKPCENFARGLTTADNSAPADYGLMLEQHGAYLKALSAAGLDVIVLDPQPNYPDAHFVEDTAVVTPEVAIITIPGAKARRGEQDSIAPVLAEFRKIEHIQAPGTVDGGDVLQVGDHFYIGISQRTNQAGAEQLGKILQRYGNTWSPVAVGAGLHLKSSVNYVGKNTLLVNSNFRNEKQFQAYEQIRLDDAEAYAANSLHVNEHLLIPGGYPTTRKHLEPLSYQMIELDVSEVRKMDGGLTCLSLRL